MLDSLVPLNESMADRVIRVVGGLFIVSLAFWGPQTPFAYLGLIFVVTGLMGRCPIYRVLGMSTCPLPESKS